MKKIARLYNKNSTNDLKIARVNCQNNTRLCDEQNITELLSIKFFAKNGSNFDWKPMAKFFNTTVQEAIAAYQLEESTMKKLQSGNNFVKFYAPECSRCITLAPVWEQLTSEFQDNEYVSLWSVDCKDQKNVCNYYNIEAYPSILNIDNGEKVEKYNGNKDLKDLEDYIQETFLPLPQSTDVTTEIYIKKDPIFDVTPENFEELIAENYTLIYFCLKRCTYCQEMNKIYDRLAQRFISSRNITIALVDCDRHPSFCITHSNGCPTISVYGNGKLIKKDYHEDTTLDGLTDLINAYATGGQFLDDWIEGDKKKRLARKQREREEDEAIRQNNNT